jgi:hypothetical protein
VALGGNLGGLLSSIYMATRRRLRIPAEVYSALGPVVVVQKPKVCRGRALGVWKPIRRKIELQEDVAPETKLATLFHEMTHVALWDSGVSAGGITREQEESVCDAISAYLTGAVLAGKLTLK